MSTHTPGPWVYLHRPVPGVDIATVSWVGDWCVGVMTPGFPGGNYRDLDWGSTAADARLIASAPDLLQALLNLVGAMCAADGSDMEADLDAIDARIADARSAISKAVAP